MNRNVLLVDDEQHVLESYRRILRKNFQLITALGGEMALQIIKSKGPFSVVVTDMNMPGMNGIELLTEVKINAPETTRMMLTGHADFNIAMEAVNEGNIFRFLTKPCRPENLIKVINDGIRQYELIKAEHELLNKTLQGSIKILIEILSMIDQEMFSKALKLRDFVRKISENQLIDGSWEIEVAALLARIGGVTIPGIVLKKMHKQDELTEVERTMISRIPKTGHDLLKNIPRLSEVARIILYQDKHFNGEGTPDDDIKGAQIPLGARIFKIFNDFTLLQDAGLDRRKVRDIMNAREGWYDESLLRKVLSDEVLDGKQLKRKTRETRRISVEEISTGMYLVDNLKTDTGQILVMAGQEITDALLIRVKNWSRVYKIKEPVYVTL